MKEDEIELILYEVNVDTNNGSQKKDNQISGDKDLELLCNILDISYQRVFSEEVVNQKTFMAALKSAAKLVLRFYDALRIYPHHDTPPPNKKIKNLNEQNIFKIIFQFLFYSEIVYYIRLCVLGIKIHSLINCSSFIGANKNLKNERLILFF